MGDSKKKAARHDAALEKIAELLAGAYAVYIEEPVTVNEFVGLLESSKFIVLSQADRAIAMQGIGELLSEVLGCDGEVE